MAVGSAVVSKNRTHLIHYMTFHNDVWLGDEDGRAMNQHIEKAEDFSIRANFSDPMVSRIRDEKISVFIQNDASWEIELSFGSGATVSAEAGIEEDIPSYDENFVSGNIKFVNHMVVKIDVIEISRRIPCQGLWVIEPRFAGRSSSGGPQEPIPSFTEKSGNNTIDVDLSDQPTIDTEWTFIL